MDKRMNHDLKLTILQKTVFANVLNTQEMALLAHHINEDNFKQGDFIIKQGQKSHGMYIIIEGKAMVTAKVLGSGSTNLENLTEGSLVGEKTIIDHSPYSISVIALEDVNCLHIPNNYFEMLFYLFPETKYKITELLVKFICESLKNQHANILNRMQKIEITPQSMLGQVIKTFHQPNIITFPETQIKFEDLLKTDIFKTYSGEELDTLFSFADIIHAPKLCTLIRSGESKSSCYIILRGAVQASVVQNNKFAKLHVKGPMSLFCSITYILNDTPALFNYTSCEQAILLRISYEKIQMIKSEKLTLWYKIYDDVAKSFASLIQFADKLEVRLNSETYNR